MQAIQSPAPPSSSAGPPKKQLVYCCCFWQPKYVVLLERFLQSAFLYSDILSGGYDLMIMTSPDLLSILRALPIYQELQSRIKFFIRPTISDLTSACSARLHLFSWPDMDQYDSILYLDTDIVLVNSLKPILDRAPDAEHMSVWHEGWLSHIFWSSDAFSKEDLMKSNGKGFSSGIMLFRNSPKMKLIFNQAWDLVSERIEKKIPIPGTTQEQAFINLTVQRNNAYQEGVLVDYVAANPERKLPKDVIHHHKVKTPTILHMSGWPGWSSNKETKMNEYMKLLLEANYRPHAPAHPELKTNARAVIDKTMDMWTISTKFRQDLEVFFGEREQLDTIVEIGSYKGFTTRHLAGLFKNVVSIDNQLKWMNESKVRNMDLKNVTYFPFDLYGGDWNQVRAQPWASEKVQVVLIDADHGYDSCKDDLLHCIQSFPRLEYVILDDYATWKGVRKIANLAIRCGLLHLERKVGLDRDIPCLQGLFSGESEGILCSVNKARGLTVSAKQTDVAVANGELVFGSYGKLHTTWGEGNWRKIGVDRYEATFRGEQHLLQFDPEHTRFQSVRHSDLNQFTGFVKKRQKMKAFKRGAIKRQNW